jgi:hypothetical protein
MKRLLSLLCVAGLLAAQEPPKPDQSNPNDPDSVIRATFKYVLERRREDSSADQETQQRFRIVGAGR